MPVVIAFARGINVGGRNKVKMAELRDCFAELGMRGVRTILQSGNVVFGADETDLGTLKDLLETGMRQRFGFEAQLLLRTPDAFRSALSSQPFSAAQLEAPNKIAVVFLSQDADAAAVASLRETNPGREEIHAAGSELYIFYTDGMARSKLTNRRIEAALNVVASARNWNTCQRLLRLLDEVEAQGS